MVIRIKPKEIVPYEPAEQDYKPKTSKSPINRQRIIIPEEKSIETCDKQVQTLPFKAKNHDAELLARLQAIEQNYQTYADCF